ncbi:MAG: TonB-dependent receptor [Chloroherpetonaceae bacterium]|nr:TonB-dependent receptor [Chloroherpetonaceae bacterium]MDW8436804.1 TonB-dependent receptor [Chloroherpetonaceae bacterium]
MRVSALLVFSLFFCQSIVSQTLTGVIEGVVRDRETKQVVVGAKVSVVGAKLGAVTDASGKFKIPDIPVGVVQVKVDAFEYNSLTKTDVVVKASKPVYLTIELSARSAQAQEVTVTANLFERAEDAKVSTNKLSQEEIRRAPGASEDVTRMMLLLPGVVVPSDSRNDLIVRGGSPAENFILIDGIEIPNINHFGIQGTGGGEVGMIQVDFLQDVTFSAGGFSSKYGDRMSSVMDIHFREGNRNKGESRAIVGTVGAGAMTEGPIGGGKGAFMISGRQSYYDEMLNLFDQSYKTTIPNYASFNLKITYDLDANHRLALIGVGGRDNIRQAPNPSAVDLNENNQWQGALGASHAWLLSKQSFIRTSLSSNYYSFFTRTVQTGTAGTPEDKYRNESSEREFVLRSDVSHRVSSDDLFEAGVVARHLAAENRLNIQAYFDPYAATLRPAVNETRKASAVKFGGYAQYTKFFLKRFSLTAGGRFDYFSYINEPLSIAPRAGLSVFLRSNLKLNFAWGVYYQSPPMVWAMAKPENRALRQMRADHFVAGVEFYPNDDLKLTLEAFAKRYRNYAASSQIPALSMANLATEFGTFGLDERLANGGIGRASGIEIFAQKKFTDDYYFIANYSFSVIEHAGLDGVFRAGSFDFRHVVSLTLGYKLDENFELGLRWRYLGGKPYTPFDEASSGSIGGFLDLSRVNALRYPAYSRLDVRVDYRLFTSDVTLTAFVDIQNATSNANVSGQIWNASKRRAEFVYHIPLLPVVGVRAEF